MRPSPIATTGFLRETAFLDLPLVNATAPRRCLAGATPGGVDRLESYDVLLVLSVMARAPQGGPRWDLEIHVSVERWLVWMACSWFFCCSLPGDEGVLLLPSRKYLLLPSRRLHQSDFTLRLEKRVPFCFALSLTVPGVTHPNMMLQCPDFVSQLSKRNSGTSNRAGSI